MNFGATGGSAAADIQAFTTDPNDLSGEGRIERPFLVFVVHLAIPKLHAGSVGRPTTSNVKAFLRTDQDDIAIVKEPLLIDVPRLALPHLNVVAICRTTGCVIQTIVSTTDQCCCTRHVPTEWRTFGTDDGFPTLPEFEIALHKATGKLPKAVKLLEDQLIENVSLKY